MERRNMAGTASIRAKHEDGATGDILDGHAAVFNITQEIWEGFLERFDPGSFTQTIKEDDILGLYNHNNLFVLGRTGAGTLEVSEDKKGLRFVNDVPDTTFGRDLVVSVERKDVAGASIGFISVDEIWAKQDGAQLRTIQTAKLFDLGPTPSPAFPDTDVDARSMGLDASRMLVAANTPPEIRQALEQRLGFAQLEEQVGEELQASGQQLRTMMDELLQAHAAKLPDLVANRVAAVLEERRQEQLEAVARQIQHKVNTAIG